MEKRTKTAIGLAALAFVLIMIALSGDFLFEERIVVYLVPFVPVGSYILLLYFVARIRKHPVALEGRVRRILIACSIFHLLLTGAYLYCVWPRTYERAEAVDDIGYFVKTLEDVHPNLYDRIPKDEFADSVRSVERGLQARVGEHDLFVDLCRLGALVRDGHTGNAYDFFMRRGNLLFRRIFPYRIRVENDRILVTGNYSYRDGIPEGSEILRINGLTAAAFVMEMGRMVSYETLPYRNTLAANPVLIAVWNDFKGYEIHFRLPESGEMRTVNAAGGIYARIQFIRSLTAIRRPYEFQVIKDSIGYIGYYRCNDPERFTVFLKETFGVVKSRRISHLIIDARENGGGNSALDDEFMQYISPMPFRTFDSVETRVSSEILAWHPDWIDSTEQVPGKKFASAEIPLTPLRENPLRFSGDCILLAGRSTFSSAAAFAAAFKCFHAGVIVGAETGGITVCYGDLYKFSLPRTGFGFAVSWKKFWNACGVDNRRGVIPDYPVEGTIEDEKTGRDAVLEYALGLARKSPAERASLRQESAKAE